MDTSSIGRLWAEGASASMAKKKKKDAESKAVQMSQTPVAQDNVPRTKYKQKVLNGINEQGSMPNAQAVGGAQGMA